MTRADFPIRQTELRVQSNDPVNDEYRLLILRAPADLMRMCRPGQFFHLLCPVTAGAAPFLRRPMSIYAALQDAGELQFLYKVTGLGTGTLATLREGDGLNVLGPLGNGFWLEDGWRHLLLVARGVGLATLAPLAHLARDTGRGITAICSARRADVLMSVDMFRGFGATVIPVTDEDGSSAPEAIRPVIDELVAAGRVDAMFTCGSNRLLRLCQQAGAAHGIPGQIALEQQMACGLGMCQCCVRSFRKPQGIRHLRVCAEGPVFDMTEAMEA
ncbi:dihydroorotate dehydrogenase electron transfer subunit [Paracoccus sediminicola]|uniref:dihydroorotate dehydrogenase electron transfer subunit n=1 Tax=Paracoccus sediminicola TaxID=3017783 RepID=UPI0022F0C89A|nr:dihydroorotate dehydrogenase electron transfer subunit [Paracoccus sediminicola]WBU56119.1 dihydroorotate dehydrogenase electron transfer subunit [Paracoccus sediminicola]